MRCPNCEKEIPLGSVECPYCYAVVAKAAEKLMRQAQTARGGARKPEKEEKAERDFSGARLKPLYYIIGAAMLAVAAAAIWLNYGKTERKGGFEAHKAGKSETGEKIFVAQPKLEGEIAKFASLPPNLETEKLDAKETELFKKMLALFNEGRWGECAGVVTSLKGTDRAVINGKKALRETAGRALALAGWNAYKYKAWPTASLYLALSQNYLGKIKFFNRPIAEAYCAYSNFESCAFFFGAALAEPSDRKEAARWLFGLSLTDKKYRQAQNYLKIFSESGADAKPLEEALFLAEAKEAINDGGVKAIFAEGFEISASGGVNQAFLPPFMELLKKAPEKLKAFMGFAPTIKVSLNGFIEFRDFARAGNVCSASLYGSAEIPFKTFAAGTELFDSAFYNVYAQAAASGASKGRCPCFVAYGLGALFEESVYGRKTAGGLHNFDKLVKAADLTMNFASLPPYMQRVATAQSYAMMKAALVKNGGAEKLVSCLKEAKGVSAEYSQNYAECVGFDDLTEWIEYAAEIFGGRL